MTLNFVLGTAAELIKIFPVMKMAETEGFGVRLVTTGQSGVNLQTQLKDFGISEALVKPLMSGAQDLDDAVSAVKWFWKAMTLKNSEFNSKLLRDKRNFVVVHGDTLSTLVGAWHGWRASVPVVHIEAGLRSNSLFNPFPEEICRRLVSRFVQFHMCPDEIACQKLSSRSGKIVNTLGNTLKDALTMNSRSSSTQGHVLVNIHRFENLNSKARWQRMIDTVLKAATGNKVLFVMHPQTRKRLELDLISKERLVSAGVVLLDRMPFSEFISLLKTARYLISDGGSNQEECSYLGMPCLLLRQTTERREGLGRSCVLSRFDEGVINGFIKDPERFAIPETAAYSTSPSKLILDTLRI